MSKLTLSPTTLHVVFSPRHEIAAVPRLSSIRRALPLSCSRASCYWSYTRPLQRPSTQDHPAPHPTWRIERAKGFGTSIVRRASPEDGNKEQPRTSADRSNEQLSPSPTITQPSLTETLKSKLKLRPDRHENIYNIPNILTFSRLIATPVIGYLIINNHPLYAFTLFVYAGFSDLLDGWIARRWHLQTVVGSVVDPMADKALMTTLVGCLAINGALPLPLAVLILGRDVSLAIAAIYYRYASLPAPKTMSRYWDFSLPSAEVHPTTVSKFNTFLQLILVGATMTVQLLHDPSALQSVAGSSLLSIQNSLGGLEGVDMLVKSLGGVVAGTTIWSGLSYAWMKDAVTILGENEEVKRKQGFKGRMIIGACFGSMVLAAGYLAVRDWVRREEELAKGDTTD